MAGRHYAPASSTVQAHGSWLDRTRQRMRIYRNAALLGNIVTAFTLPFAGLGFLAQQPLLETGGWWWAISATAGALAGASRHGRRIGLAAANSFSAAVIMAQNHPATSTHVIGAVGLAAGLAAFGFSRRSLNRKEGRPPPLQEFWKNYNSPPGRHAARA
jgi:hypothetical protein